MHSFHQPLALGLGLLFSCGLLPAASSPDWPQLSFTEIASGLSFPTDIAHAGDGSGRLFVCEQSGRVMLIASNGAPPQVFLDLRDRVHFSPGGQDGLLGLAFPSNYQTQRCFFVYYNNLDASASFLSRFCHSTNSDLADPASEEVLLESQPRGGYLNGGQLTFGPDGFLYLAVGDDGFSQFASNSAQNPMSLRGKILRLDVSTSTNTYLIPPNNPFVGNAGFRPEIWALGLRNPFRFSFDRLTGDFFTCDVGQTTWEEIDYQPAALAGGQNYGWPVKEGNHDYSVLDPFLGALTPPVAEYIHINQSAVVGGYVYRGPSQPRFDGTYFFADFVSGRIWAMRKDGAAWVAQAVGQAPFLVSTFGEDDLGRLHLGSYLSGKIYRMDDSGKAAPVVFNPSGGVSTDDSVTLSSISPGVTIRYTADGSDPTSASPSLESGGTVTIVDGARIRAQAFRSDLSPSAVSEGLFSLRVATPAFTPAQGPVTNGTLISIHCATPAATIRYTLDGTEPSPASLTYSGPISINGSTPLKARAFRAGFQDSLTASFLHTPLRIQTTILADINDLFSLNWQSVTGKTYQVQFSDDFKAWYNLGKPLSGTGQPLSFTNSAQYPLPLRRFLRIAAQDL